MTIISTIKGCFPKKLPHLAPNVQLSHCYYLKLETAMIENAMSSPSPRTDHGYLALVIRAAQYQIDTTFPWDPPIHPGSAPVHAAGAT
jgi:hypothetical protein